MWKRFVRLIRSILGWFFTSVENPELILEQLIEDMRANLVNMRNNAVGVIAAEKQLMTAIQNAQERIAQLDAQVRVAVKAGKDDIATTLIGAKTAEEKNLTELQAQLTKAHQASEQAKQLIHQYELKVQKAINEKLQLIAESKRAKMQEQLAKTMASFSVADDFDTLDKMRSKIQERGARAEAMVELGSDTVDTQIQKIEESTMNVAVNEKLLEYKRQLGVAAEEAPAAKTLDPLAIKEQPPKLGG